MRDGPKDLLDIKDAAELLQVSETSLRRWTNTGRLACLRVGKKRERRFRRADLLAFLEQQPAAVAPLDTTERAPAELPPQYTVIGGVPIAFGTHLCSLYASDIGRTKLAVGFLADGLREGCASHLLATPEAARQVLDELARHHPALEAELACGRLVISDYADSAAQQLEKLEVLVSASLRAGAKAIRVVGNVSEGHIGSCMSFTEVTDYEDGYEALVSRRFPVVTLCQYDARAHSGVELLEVLKRHRDVFRFARERLLF
jgi:transcriptional repressor of dcmA and dcmR